MPAKFNILVAATIPLVPLIPLLACGGDSKTPDASIHVTDSGSGSNGSNGSATCTGAASYGAADFGSGSDQFAGTQGSGAMHFEEWGGLIASTLVQGMKPDEVHLELYANSGGFTGDIKTGTFTISGADAQYKTCGICFRMFTDESVTGSGSNAMVMSTDEYFATGGTVTLTSVSGSNFSGTLSNITMAHVTIGSDFTSTPVGDCTSTLTSGTMATTLQVGSAAFTGHFNSPYPANVISRRYY